jgi:beta-galactosidase
MVFFKKATPVFVLFIGILYSMDTLGQSIYSINIPDETTIERTGFLKMGTDISPTGEVLSYTDHYLTKNNKPWFPTMGEMHFSRCAEKDWESSIIKMKSAGIEIISTYVLWIYHEETEGKFNWKGDNNIRKFLSLCQKHGMYVWLRPGPWAHAEARNGGFPDWLLEKHIGLRKNDSSYLHYVKIYFDELGKQCKGMLFKDGGPIIATQLENELQFKKPEAYAHMKTLKQLIIQAGLDLPYYSAFGQGPDDQDEFLYTLGGYGDSPWAQHTHKMFKPVYYIKPLEGDTDIGADLFGKVDGKVRNTFPKISAEIGGGLQDTYHRRVEMSPKDVAAVPFTRIASGMNGLGYYMFHGGMNQFGKTSFQESRETGYPNDVPLISYDFQAPIGAMNIIHPSYNELRLLNTFAKDFGEMLVTEKPYFPKVQVASPFSYDTVQCSARIHDGRGFLFFSNYQRFVDLPTVKNFQMELHTKNGTVQVPEKPMDFKANSYIIWPYNLPMGNTVLKYATAQPYCILKNEGKQTYVFFSDADAEFVFDGKGVQSCVNKTNSQITHEGNNIRVKCMGDKTAAFDILTTESGRVSVLFLPRTIALDAVKVHLGEKELLVISKANLFFDEKNLLLEDFTEKVKCSVYPSAELIGNTELFSTKQTKKNGLFAEYELNAKKALTASLDLKKKPMASSETAAIHFKDSLLAERATKKNFNKYQPGPLYQIIFHDLPKEATYQVRYDAPTDPLIKDWIANIVFSGDVMAIYRNDTLKYDLFNNNDTCKIKLGYMSNKTKGDLLIQVLPLDNGEDIYVEDKMLEKKNKEWLNASIKSITLKPVYCFKLSIK